MTRSFYVGTYLNSSASQVISKIHLAGNRRILSHFTTTTLKVHLSRGRRTAKYLAARLSMQRNPFAVHPVHHSRLAQCKISVSRRREVGIMFGHTKSNKIRLMRTDKYFISLDSLLSPNEHLCQPFDTFLIVSRLLHI